MLALNNLTKMELALIAEAERRLYCWWPSTESTFWIPYVAKLAVLGERADAEALGVSPAGHIEIAKTLAHFNESADLKKSAILPNGWRIVPCPPTEEMLKACLATWPGQRPHRRKSIIEQVRHWFSTWRHQGRSDPTPPDEARLQWLEERRADFTINFLAMVEQAPPPPWAPR